MLMLCHAWCVVVMMCDGMRNAGDTDAGEGRKICISACVCIVIIGGEDVVRDVRLCVLICVSDDVLRSGWWGGCRGQWRGRWI